MTIQEQTYSDLGPDQSARRYALIGSLKQQIKDEAIGIRAAKLEVRSHYGDAGAVLQSRLHSRRLEARARYLIYGPLRGRTWDQIENKHAEKTHNLRYWIAQLWNRLETDVPMPEQLKVIQ